MSVHGEVIVQASGFPVRDCVQAGLGVWITVRGVSQPAPRRKRSRWQPRSEHAAFWLSDAHLAAILEAAGETQ